jgi:KaiC/GvpD/RAD55 family RecA-like ATPase
MKENTSAHQAQTPSALPVANKPATNTPPTLRSIGIAALDHILYGGLEQGSTWLAEGIAGSGKSLLATHFLAAGVRQGEPGMLITASEAPASIMRFYSRCWPMLESAPAQRLLTILDPSPFFTEIRLAKDSNGRTRTTLWDEVWRFVQEVIKQSRNLGAKRIVIDPITPLLLAYDSPIELWDTTQMLVNALNENLGTTTLLTHSQINEPRFMLVAAILRAITSGTLIVEHSSNLPGEEGINIHIPKRRHLPVRARNLLCSINEGGHILGLEQRQYPLRREHAA